MVLNMFNFVKLIYCLWGGFFLFAWVLVPVVCDIYSGPGKVLDSLRPDAGKRELGVQNAHRLTGLSWILASKDLSLKNVRI